MAYVTTAMILLSALVRFHEAETADYMIPMAFVELDALPLTMGKLDATCRPRTETMEHSKTLSTSNATEKLLAGIWRAVLGLDQIGRQDNFFELGGHSLLATQVASRISQAFYDLKCLCANCSDFPRSPVGRCHRAALDRKLEALGETKSMSSPANRGSDGYSQ